jgi:hypothetical protein
LRLYILNDEYSASVIVSKFDWQSDDSIRVAY